MILALSKGQKLDEELARSNCEVAVNVARQGLGTAGHHVQHIYAKIGVSTRAAATMFAMEHNLLVRQ